MPLVVMVCTGNICRSPMAEAMLRARLLRHAAAHIQVSSMGTGGLVGKAAWPLARQVCLERGIDIGGHRSRGLDRGELARAALVLTMEIVHGELVTECCPEAADRTALLGAWPRAAATLDDMIPDPMGQPARFFRVLADSIERHVERIAPILLQSHKCQPPST